MDSNLFDESHYLPFSVSSLPQGAWLILAPHADDESFGMGGSLLLARKENIPVYILIMTDGAVGGDTNTRNEESMAAAKIIGAKGLFFLRQKDRKLSLNSNIVTKVMELIKDKKIKNVFFPHPMEPHPDHRATAVIGWEAIKQGEFEAKGYSYEISTQGIVNKLINISDVIDHKRELMLLYKSQLEHNNYIDLVIALNQTRTWSLPPNVLYAEAFYEWECKNTSLNKLSMIHIKKLLSCNALGCLQTRGIDWIKELL